MAVFLSKSHQNVPKNAENTSVFAILNEFLPWVIEKTNEFHNLLPINHIRKTEFLKSGRIEIK